MGSSKFKLALSLDSAGQDWDLLPGYLEDKIPSSFTNFITTPDLSSPVLYEPGYLSYRNYGIFIGENLSVTSFLSALNTFLIVILLDPSLLVFTISSSNPD